MPELKQSMRSKLPIPIATPKAISKFFVLLANMLCSDNFIAERYDKFCFRGFFAFFGSIFSLKILAFSFLYLLFCLSLTILPSEISTTREEIEATFSECVTIITSFPLSAISFKIFSICMVVEVSSAPVGSSAMMMSGLLIKARAIATRCFCPPES